MQHEGKTFHNQIIIGIYDTKLFQLILTFILIKDWYKLLNI